MGECGEEQMEVEESDGPPIPLSVPGLAAPTNVEVDESPLLRPSIQDKNKESLRLRLQNRRPINQLQEQGILPAPNTPPAFACQRVKLERARMGDLLKAKIQSRPKREELVRQHILEESDVSPLLAEKQRMLKRARLADSLNDHLIHRPGPLELVQKNILKPEQGQFFMSSPGSGADSGCGQGEDSSSSSSGSEETSGSSNNAAPIPEPVLEKTQESAAQLSSSCSTRNAPTAGLNGFVGVAAVGGAGGNSLPPSSSKKASPSAVSSSSGKKKSGSKSSSSGQKPKAIKFHEYKGPPSVVNSRSGGGGGGGEDKGQGNSAYELLLQQQQMFLQWQLEWQHRFPKILLPAKPVVTTASALVSPSSSNPTPSPNGPLLCPPAHPHTVTLLSESGGEQTSKLLAIAIPSTTPTTTVVVPATTPTGPPALPPLNNAGNNGAGLPWKDLKVNELKAELKRRSLPVSGSKTQLLERLKNALEGGGVSAAPPPPSAAAPLPAVSLETKEQTNPSSPVNVSRSVLQKRIQERIQQQQQQQKGNSAGTVGSVAAQTQPQPAPQPIQISSGGVEQQQPPSALEYGFDFQDDVKSQMVDDVLEILIRNGELPADTASGGVASAPLHSSVGLLSSPPPHSPTAPTSNSISGSAPPPPPLPPSTFAVTLPTEILFRPKANHLPSLPQPANQQQPPPPPPTNQSEEEEIRRITRELENMESMKFAGGGALWFDGGVVISSTPTATSTSTSGGVTASSCTRDPLLSSGSKSNGLVGEPFVTSSSVGVVGGSGSCGPTTTLHPHQLPLMDVDNNETELFLLNNLSNSNSDVNFNELWDFSLI